jgi:carbamate kinase
MGPKIEAVIQFVTRGGNQVLITDVEHLRDTLAGHEETLVLPM